MKKEKNIIKNGLKIKQKKWKKKQELKEKKEKDKKN